MARGARLLCLVDPFSRPLTFRDAVSLPSKGKSRHALGRPQEAKGLAAGAGGVNNEDAGRTQGQFGWEAPGERRGVRA